MLVDFKLHLIDRRIRSDDRLGKGGVPIEECPDGLVDGLLHHRPHPQEEHLQLFYVVVEVTHCVMKSRRSRSIRIVP